MQLKIDRAIFSELGAFGARVYPLPEKQLADPREIIMAAAQRAVNGKLQQSSRWGRTEEILPGPLLPATKQLKKTGKTKVGEK